MKKASQPMTMERHYCCANCGEDFRKGQQIFTATMDKGEYKKMEKTEVLYCSSDCREQYVKKTMMEHMETIYLSAKNEIDNLKMLLPKVKNDDKILTFGKLRLKTYNTMLLMIKSIKMKDATSYYRLKSLLQEYFEELIAQTTEDKYRLNTSDASMFYLNQIENFEQLFTM
jgi:hypothetical protein